MEKKYSSKVKVKSKQYLPDIIGPNLRSADAHVEFIFTGLLQVFFFLCLFFLFLLLCAILSHRNFGEILVRGKTIGTLLAIYSTALT